MQKDFNPFNKKIGILGGGQLGRMIIQSATDFNFSIHVMDPDSDAPCKDIAETFTVGKLTREEDVYSFGKDKDIITVEIENVNTEALRRLEKEGKFVFPQPDVIELIQDKGAQKMFYQKHNIPTADFFLVENRESIKRYSDYFPFFQKLRKGGYDGKGVQSLENPNQLEKSFDAPSVLEKKVDFEKEISVIVARNFRGEIKTYPAVECEFSKEANLVEFLFAPAQINRTQEQEAAAIAVKIIEKLNMVGILAVEFFLTKEGKWLVNEIAPRPHNSGHHTIEANSTSQFEQHLRSITNLPLGETSLLQPAVMVNLLGEPGYEGTAKYDGLADVLCLADVHIHLYGKKKTKPFRKMGHVTITDKDLKSAKLKAKKVQERLKIIA